MQRFSQAAGALVIVALVTSCSPPSAPSDPEAGPTHTVTASPTTTEPSETIQTTEATETTEAVTTDPNDGGSGGAGVVPAALVGTWDSVDQGSAEDLIEIHPDGSYLRAMVLMQQRPSGMFSYTIGTKGNVEVQGTTLRLVPTEGTESMTDPDSPADSYTDQPTDLTPEVYQWSASNGSIFLDGQYGVVEFRPST